MWLSLKFLWSGCRSPACRFVCWSVSHVICLNIFKHFLRRIGFTKVYMTKSRFCRSNTCFFSFRGGKSRSFCIDELWTGSYLVNIGCTCHNKLWSKLVILESKYIKYKYILNEIHSFKKYKKTLTVY